jgi:hypothetical protein
MNGFVCQAKHSFCAPEVEAGVSIYGSQIASLSGTCLDLVFGK